MAWVLWEVVCGVEVVGVVAASFNPLCACQLGCLFVPGVPNQVENVVFVFGTWPWFALCELFRFAFACAVGTNR